MSELQSTMAEKVLDKKQFLSKITSMKEHLQALLQKKLRLELEIKSLKKSIQERQKNFLKSMTSVKISAGLEGSSLTDLEDPLLVSLRDEAESLDQRISEALESCQKLISTYEDQESNFDETPILEYFEKVVFRPISD